MEIKNIETNLKKQYPKINELNLNANKKNINIFTKMGMSILITKIALSNKVFAGHSNLSPSDLGGLTATPLRSKNYDIPLTFQIISAIIFFISIAYILYTKFKKKTSKANVKKFFKILMIISVIIFLISSIVILFIYF